jgi:Holliday junction resolvase-like predicted endonuclease
MTNENNVDAEALTRLTDYFRREGFAVELHPDLRGEGIGEPDLIARRGADTLVVQVKTSRNTSDVSASLAHMAEAVQKHNWRFAVAVIPGSGEPVVQDVLSPDEIRAQAAQLHELPEGSSAAVLVAWATLEATIRTALVASGIAPPTVSPQQLLQLAAAQGLVSPDDERALHRFVAIRNRAAHGLRAATETVDTVTLIAIVERLLERALSRER